MKIYTKGGDTGKTSLIGRSEVLKNALRVSAYGDIDELNSVVGLLASSLDPESKEIMQLLQQLQNRLFDLGSELASANDENIRKLPRVINLKDIESLELNIDDWEKDLEPLKNFILPGGSTSASFSHLARTVTRRAERSIVALSQVEPIRPEVIQFINRLSDWFFILARLLNRRAHVDDIKWSK